MKFSVVIPAHNEAGYLLACLDALQRAAEHHRADTEVIVVLNRCTDETGQIAEAHGATVVQEDQRNLAAIRNTGACAATGDVLVTVDADSVVSKNLFSEIERALQTGRYVGGCVVVLPERTSLGIAMTYAVLQIVLFFTRLGGGVYWCRLDDFRAIGGFNEALPFGEDLDFAKRLRAHGRRNGRKFTTLKQANIVTSCRKFDTFGDWYFFKLAAFHGRELRGGLKGTNTAFQDRFFYDFNNAPQNDQDKHHKPDP